MISRREEARRKREEEQQKQKEEDEMEMKEKVAHLLDELLQQVEYEKKRKANPSMTWKPHTMNNDNAKQYGT